MSSKKRPAPEPLLPSRSPKQPRFHLEFSDNNRSEPIFGRWVEMAKDFGELCKDTLKALTSWDLSSSSTPEPNTPSLVDEVNLSSSPTSLSLATPRQTPSPRRRADINISSNPKQDNDVSIPSFSSAVLPSPTRPAHLKAWVPQDPPLDGDPFRILEDTNFSTPKAQHTRSSNPEHWSTLKDSLPTCALEDDSLPSPRTPHSQGSSDTSLRESVTSKSSTLVSAPKSRGQVSKKPARRSHRQPIKRRKHIYDEVHRAYVVRSKLELREELSQEYYERKIRQGYQSSYPEFKGWLSYRKKLEDLNAAPSSLGLLASTSAQSPGTSEDEITPEYLQRALDIFDATMKGPKPPRPNLPSISELEARKRAKQEAIDRLLRPPPLPTSLSPEEEQQVSTLLHKRGVISKFAREQVSDQDISRLRPGQWLNDEIINFYGAMILARSEGSKENPAPTSKGKGKTKMKAPLNVHYFSSFFWTKLTQEGYDKGRLAKWTKKLDIFSKDAILMPVNHGNAHWTAAAINFRQKRFESYDSMNMAKSRVFQVLRSYVNSEHLNKKNKPFNFDGWEDWAPASTPQQENGYDCGVFTCQFLESLSRGEDFFNFSQSDMHYLRKRMIWEIGNGKFYHSC